MTNAIDRITSFATAVHSDDIETSRASLRYLVQSCRGLQELAELSIVFAEATVGQALMVQAMRAEDAPPKGYELYVRRVQLYTDMVLEIDAELKRRESLDAGNA